MTHVIALTGGIGSGKSTIASLFAERGVPIIDADIIARELTQPKTSVFSAIIEHFGKSVVLKDGSLNRTQLRELVFANLAERRWLENLLHPLIRKQIEESIKKITAPYCIVVIPLLFENQPYFFINRILVIDTSEKNQMERVAARDHSDPALVKKILQSQVSREVRLAGADDVIVNNGNLAELAGQVDRFHQFYLGL